MTYTIAAFYRFIALPHPEVVQAAVRTTFTDDELCGTLLIAEEGVNGTMAGTGVAIERLLSLLEREVGLMRGEVKFSYAEELPFGRLKIKLKREIIAFRETRIDTSRPGTYVQAESWNDLIADPEVVLLDTRNRYETEVGTFAGAIDPGIDKFSDFITYVRENLDPEIHKKVAMFCTGGIRCEKASAFMLQQGFAEVYHLQGGILKYLETVPPAASTWEGSCFVFDRRRGVGFEDFED